MADYWKSQPRKFCQYCKCWIADNKPSIEFHERGKNHKENVAAKISEIKKKSVEKAKQEERMTKQFAAMEEAAMKAYEEDLKRIEMESKGLPYTAPAKPPPKPQAKPQPKKTKKNFEKPRGKPRQKMEAPVWVEGVSDEGHTYYYNTITGESRWEKPDNLQGESSTSAQCQQTEIKTAQSSSGSAWMEALSPDGYTYYYNSETGESSWEKPADFPSSEEAQPTAESIGEEASQSDPAAPQDETPSGVEESSGGVTAEVSEQSNQESKVPKISFRKRKVEGEPLEKEEDDKAGDDKSSTDENAEETKKQDEVQSGTVEPEKTAPTAEAAPHVKRPRKANPYGVWEKIKEEVDPYAKVDLQLPQVEESTASAPADLPPEPKPKFRERVITSLGEEGGGPASFRKNKTQNGKSRSLRQRDNDD